MAMLVTKRVIADSTEFSFGEGKITMGEMVDRQIAEAIDKGYQLFEINVHIADEEWGELVRSNFNKGDAIAASTPHFKSKIRRD